MKLKLVKKFDETANVKSFFWEPSEEVNFIPGQYFYYTLPKLNYEDARGETRHFTLSNSPTEGELLRLTTKFSESYMSGYKKTLLDLHLGSVIEGRGPQGVFTIHNSPHTTHICIAGGIGITPFRSIIKYNFDNKLKLPYLIYSNSDENFAFGNELKEMLGDKLVLFNSSKEGHLDASKLKNFISNHLVSAHFYVVGPSKFVDAIELALEQLGVDSGKIESEKFTGYIK